MGMARKRHKAEEIVAKLRQVEVLTAQGEPLAEALSSPIGAPNHKRVEQILRGLEVEVFSEPSPGVRLIY